MINYLSPILLAAILVKVAWVEAVAPREIDWTTIALALIAAMVTLGAPVIAYLLARLNTTTKETQVAVGQVHGVVNSSATAMQKSLDDALATILKLSTDNATLSAGARAAELSTAKAERVALGTATVSTPLP